jgi:hypothetical protein
MIRPYDEYKKMAEESRRVAEELALYRRGELRNIILAQFNCMNDSNTFHFPCFELSAKEIHQVLTSFLNDTRLVGYPFNAYNLDTDKCTRLCKEPGGLGSCENCLSVRFHTVVKGSAPDKLFLL